MAHSFSFNGTDMGAYGITVIGGNWPFASVGLHEALNIPGMAGGYSYTNEAITQQFTMDVIATADDADDLISNLQSFATATPVTANGTITLDGISNYHWVGRRISPIECAPLGMNTVEFTITWHLDTPGPIAGGT